MVGGGHCMGHLLVARSRCRRSDVGHCGQLRASCAVRGCAEPRDAVEVFGRRPGVSYAIASGALTSGLGYAIWYTALKGLKATSAATVQLSVPVIATIGGALLLAST